MTDLLLTPKQKMLLDFITAFRAERGYAPSQYEIASHFGFKSLGTVQNYLVRLERQGALRKTWNARRGMQVVAPQPQLRPHRHPRPYDERGNATSEAVPLPLLGRVAAGRPIEVVQNSEMIEVPSAMIKRGTHFVLRVTGDSMIEDGILDGDYVVIRKQNDAENGQTVVAIVDGGATIKRYQNRKGKIELLPANAKYEPIVVGEEAEFRIEGVLAGVVRIFG